jgi:aspartyl protease family protein
MIGAAGRYGGAMNDEAKCQRQEKIPTRSVPAAGQGGSPKHLGAVLKPSPDVRKTARAGALWVTVFWLAVLTVVYLLVQQFEQARAARYKTYAASSSEMVIPRSPDGHFYVAGEINGHALEFLVDTGASSVVVTDAFAEQAGLHGGQPMTFMTANGPRPGRLLRGVPVRAGILSADGVAVGVGLFASAGNRALLGQSFLSKFDVLMRQDHMVLKQRGQGG